MGNIQESLRSAMELNGTIGVALVDANTGMTLGSAGGNQKFNVELAAAGYTDVVRAKTRAVKLLDLEDSTEDILITMGNQYHMIRVVNNEAVKRFGNLFLYIVMEKQRASLALSRFKIAEIERGLKVA